MNPAIPLAESILACNSRNRVLDLCSHKANNLNFHSTPNLEKNKKPDFWLFWAYLDHFWPKMNFLKKLSVFRFTITFYHAKHRKN